MTQIIPTKTQFMLRPLSRVLIVATIVLSLLGSGSANADETRDLQVSLQKLNYWLNGSQQAEGWRRALSLNKLETQVALGNLANIQTLQSVLNQFSSGYAGLQHPRFQETKTAIERQIARLQRSRSRNLGNLLQDAKLNFRKPDTGSFASEKYRTIGQLETMRWHYQTQLSPRERQRLFDDIQLDEMLAFINGLKFEVAPEVSVGKIQSMIRDVKSDLRKVTEKIDAMPITTPGPDDEVSKDDADPSNNSSDNVAAGGLQLTSPTIEGVIESGIARGPSEDDDGQSLDELLAQQSQLEKKLKALATQQRDVRKKDRPRQKLRATNVKQLRVFEKQLAEYQETQGNPYFAGAKNALLKLSRSYFYATSGNLQEEMLERIETVDQQLQKLRTDANDRAASGQLGDALRWLDDAGQAEALVTAIRTRYSTPNGFISVSKTLVNRLASRPVSQQMPVNQEVLGRLVRGSSNTQGQVSFQFFNDPNQIRARIQLDANVHSDTYIKQRRLKVCTSSTGVVHARRDIFANVGGIFWGGTLASAAFDSKLTGTSSRLRIVKRIASKKFEQSRPEANKIAVKQAKEKVCDEFGQQSREPLEKAQTQLSSAVKRAYEKSYLLPSVFLRSTPGRLHSVIKQETAATLAAPQRPKEFGVRPEIAVRVHETMVSNYLDETFRGKTFTNEELAEELAALTGEMPAGLTGENAEGEAAEDFEITFARIRPIQFEFTDQKIRVVVAGRKFAQGDQKIDAGLKIILQFEIVNQGGQLVLKRSGKVEFEFIDPKRTTPTLVAFRRFLDERLNDSKVSKGTESDLPANLIPIDAVPELADSPVAQKLRLTQFRLDGGWAYLGWNHEPYPGAASGWIYDLAGIKQEYVIR